MELINLTVKDFAALTASDAPAPGGGSISALCGALSAALVEMVANLTVNKEKYQDYQEEMSEIITNISSDRQALLVAVDDDTKAFDKYMAALKLPKGSEERKAAMQEGLKEAALVPLSVAKRVCTLFPSIEKVLTHGNSNAVTDAMVATMLARTCALGAIYNVRINLSSIHDEAFVKELEGECDTLQNKAVSEEARLLKNISISGF
ncbi:MAG: cyclodeaminase/cyclohydrolase family protein [Oscillospiraceae bacterium]|nr:cyclodeaminase/cyclohydrolase family protein [Oscillospiraceae bacterium]